MTAQGVIQSGARWRVGIGDQVKIWKDSWLPDMRSPWIESPPAMGLTEATADSLETLLGNTWDEDILADLFNSQDQPLIKQTLLSSSPPRPTHPLSAIMNQTMVRKKLWSLPIPPKVKLFIWRPCVNLLPNRAIVPYQILFSISFVFEFVFVI